MSFEGSLLDSDLEKSKGRTTSILYEIGVICCAIWLLITGADWGPFILFVAGNLAAFGLFSNRIWKHRSFMLRPLDTMIGFIGNVLLLGSPAVFLLDRGGVVRCLIGLGVYVGVRLLMLPPPNGSWRRRPRGSRS